MICYTSVYFDSATYALYYETEMPPTLRLSKKNLIKVPKIDEIKMINGYLEKHPEVLDEINGEVNGDSFHWAVNDAGMYDDWIDFQRNYILDFAADWCKSMGIRYKDDRES